MANQAEAAPSEIEGMQFTLHLTQDVCCLYMYCPAVGPSCRGAQKIRDRDARMFKKTELFMIDEQRIK